MSSGMRFILSLVERVSGPSRRVSGALNRTRRALEDLRSGGRSFDEIARRAGLTEAQVRRLAAANNALAGTSRAWNTMKTWASGFQAQLSGIHSIMSSLVSLPSLIAAGMTGLMGKFIIDSASFRENTLTSMEIQLKSAKEAQKFYQQALSFASKTPFETRETVDYFQRLLAAQFKPIEVPVVMSAIGDLSSLRGFDRNVIDRAITAILQIKAKGKVMGEEITGQLGETGFPIARFYDILAKKIGVTKDEVMKLQAAGKINADLGVWGIMQAIKEGVSGGEKLGNVMEKISQNLTGLWSTLTSRPFEIFSMVETTGGYDTLKALIKNLGEGLDTTTDRGKKLVKLLSGATGRVFERLFGPLEKMTRGDGVTRIVDNIVKKVDQFSAWWAVTLPLVRSTWAAFVDGFMVGWSAFKGAWEAIRPVVNWLGQFIAKMTGLETSTKDGSANIARVVGLLASFAVVTQGAAFVLGGLFSGVIAIVRIFAPAAQLIGSLANGLIFLGKGLYNVGAKVFGFLMRFRAFQWVVAYSRALVVVLWGRLVTALRFVGTMLWALARGLVKFGFEVLKITAGALWGLVKQLALLGWAGLKAGAKLLWTWAVTAGGRVLSMLSTAGSALLTFGRGLMLMGATALRAGFMAARAWLIGLGPVGWIILAVSAVVAAFVWCYNNVAWFRDGVNAAWTWIVSSTQKLWAGLTGFFASGWESIKSGWEGLKTWFASLPERFAAFGKNMIQGLINGIMSMVSGPIDAIKEIGSNAISALKGVLGIKSPSREFRYLGEMTGLGMQRGLEGYRSQVQRTARALGLAAMTGAAVSGPVMPTLTQQVERVVSPLKAGAQQVEQSVTPGASAASLVAPVGAQGGISVTLTVNLNAPQGTTPAAVREQVAASAALIEEHVYEALRRLGLEGGIDS